MDRIDAEPFTGLSTTSRKIYMRPRIAGNTEKLLCNFCQLEEIFPIHNLCCIRALCMCPKVKLLYFISAVLSQGELRVLEVLEFVGIKNRQ